MYMASGIPQCQICLAMNACKSLGKCKYETRLAGCSLQRQQFMYDCNEALIDPLGHIPLLKQHSVETIETSGFTVKVTGTNVQWVTIISQ